uniref:Cytochrome oxidase subunit 1 n=1 Tax=Heterorhabditis bacteriophora TaxID=37862 RepID=A0A1I7WQW3_HETBA
MKDKRQKVGGIGWPLLHPQLAYMLNPFGYDMWSVAFFRFADLCLIFFQFITILLFIH